MATIAITPGLRGIRGENGSGAATATTIGYIGLGVAAVLMLALHYFAPAGLDPLSAPMSDYALAEGVGWMFGASVAAFAIAGLGATIALARAGLLNTPLARSAMWLTVASAAVTAAFPTDEQLPLSTTGEIHRYGAITLFSCVPVVGLLIGQRLSIADDLRPYRTWLLASSTVAVALLVVFLLSHLAVMPESVQDLRGLFQRLLMVVELAVLALICVLGAPGRRNDAAASRIPCTHADVLIRGQQPDRAPGRLGGADRDADRPRVGRSGSVDLVRSGAARRLRSDHRP